ncbi:hypothetical protein Pcinc_018797 [Petrolisthes cinctipes]|uniref:Uncharacterized protein n=1 Tax=Petrolisthes cinctipes TaxID=88211 RepID=A0AAE1KMC1_PETCI|nr:hypothetical protein Pcinc_018797 [Petrolisthes cinctipes]
MFADDEEEDDEEEDLDADEEGEENINRMTNKKKAYPFQVRGEGALDRNHTSTYVSSFEISGPSITSDSGSDTDSEEKRIEQVKTIRKAMWRKRKVEERKQRTEMREEMIAAERTERMLIEQEQKDKEERRKVKEERKKRRPKWWREDESEAKVGASKSPDPWDKWSVINRRKQEMSKAFDSDELPMDRY